MTVYNDTHLLSQIQQELHLLPPLINSTEINQLKKQLIDVFYARAFIMQMGDCAEKFSDAEQAISHLKCQQLIYLKSLLENKIKTPVITIGRIAGQYAKPRSAATEIVDGKSIFAYYGDMINGEEDKLRNPDPQRILKAYYSSKKVLSHMAAFKESIFTSHESLLLEYEKPLTRLEHGVQYNLSTHLPWLGMRNILSEQHINYLSAIDNPIAIKIGPQTLALALVSALQKINPQNQPGKIILIARLGVANVKNVLPKLIEVIRKHQFNVIWMCDPMHGNTQRDQYGKKFRMLGDAVDETLEVHNILRQHEIYLGGLHLEASYRDDILECISSVEELTENRVYDSALDPRLNHSQCINYLEKISKSYA